MIVSSLVNVCRLRSIFDSRATLRYFESSVVSRANVSQINFCVSQERLSQSQELRFYAGVSRSESTDHLPPELEFSFPHREAGCTPQKYGEVHGAKSQECRTVCIQKESGGLGHLIGIPPWSLIVEISQTRSVGRAPRGWLTTRRWCCVASSGPQEVRNSSGEAEMMSKRLERDETCLTCRCRAKISSMERLIFLWRARNTLQWLSSVKLSAMSIRHVTQHSHHVRFWTADLNSATKISEKDKNILKSWLGPKKGIFI